MDHLSVLDAAFLHLETPDMPMHVGAVHFLHLPASRHAGFIDDLKRHVADRLHALPVFARKLATMPLGVANPVWVADDDIDLDYHVRHARLPGPGTLEQLERHIADQHALPLDRGRPLWELHVIEGHAGGKLVVYAKVHHAALDGQGAGALYQTLMDATPHAPAPSRPEHAAQPEAAPSTTGLLSSAVLHSVRQAYDLVRNVPAHLRAAVSLRSSRPALAPRSVFNATITGERQYAMMGVPLDEMARAGKAFGSTINSALLAVVSGALRRYLLPGEALPGRSMVAGVPVSLRTRESGHLSNQVGMWFVQLATDEEDPAARMRHIVTNTKAMRLGVSRARTLMLTDLPSFGLPWLMEGAIALVGRARLADALPMPVNLVVSNVSGPQQSLYLAGARVESAYPVAIVTHGLALNVTAQSYCGTLCIGVTAAASAVPDMQRFMAAMRDSHRELMRAAGVHPEPELGATKSAPKRSGRRAKPAADQDEAPVRKPRKRSVVSVASTTASSTLRRKRPAAAEPEPPVPAPRPSRTRARRKEV